MVQEKKEMAEQFSAKKLLQIIKDADWKNEDERRELVKQFIRMPDSPVKNLIPFLKRENLQERKQKYLERLKSIQEILIHLGDGSLMDMLIKMAFSIEPDGRNVIITVLSALASKGASNLKPILQFLKVDDPAVQSVGMKILLQIPGHDTIEAVTKALERNDWFSKRPGILVISKLAGDNAPQYLRRTAHDGNPTDKACVIEILEKLGNSAAIDLLLDMLRDSDPKIRLLVIQSIGRMKTPKALTPLVEILQTETGPTLPKILQVIVQISDNMSDTTLFDLFKNQPSNVKLLAINALEQVASIRSVGTLILLLKDRDIRTAQIAQNSLKKLSEQNRTVLAKAISSLLASETPIIRKAGLDFLKNQATPDFFLRFIQILLQDESVMVRDKVIEGLRELDESKILPALLAMLRDPSEVCRRYAVEILTKWRSLQILPPLLELLNDSDWWVRERTIEAIGNLRDARALPALVKLLSDKNCQGLVATALGTIGDPRVVPALLALLPSADTAAKADIIMALGKLNDQNVIEPLKKLIGSEEKEVRDSSRKVLEAFGVTLEKRRPYTNTIDLLLDYAKKNGATDLYLTADSGALMRVKGDIARIDKVNLKPEEIETLILKLLLPLQREHFMKTNDLDFSYEVDGVGRFRANVYRQRSGINAVFRVIPERIPRLDELSIPAVVTKLTRLQQGLILVTGPSGCGKSTTVAALINHMNETRRDHILVLEDPIEFIHMSKNCLVNQRGIGAHCKSFASALRSALREDPDIIVVGELRDLETISLALTAAETGHLVISTMNTQSAEKTIDRVIDAFPSDEQGQIRMMFSESVRAILSQRLVWSKNRDRKVAVMEVLLGIPALRKLIRDGQTYLVQNVIMTGVQYGMQSLDQALLDGVKRDIISAEDAYYYANEKRDFEFIEQK
jgi:twitching motility protein PilT